MKALTDKENIWLNKKKKRLNKMNPFSKKMILQESLAAKGLKKNATHGNDVNKLRECAKTADVYTQR